jgi:hypothetical protein
MVNCDSGLEEDMGSSTSAPQSSTYLAVVIAMLLGSGLCLRLPALLPMAAGAAGAARRSPEPVILRQLTPAERALEAPAGLTPHWSPPPVEKLPPAVPVVDPPVAEVLAIQGTMLVGARHFAVTPTGLRQEGELIGSYRIQKIKLDHVSVVSGRRTYELDVRTGRLSPKD